MSNGEWDKFKTELKKRADIVSVVSQHVSLRQNGKNFIGLCPFHREKEPSFYVYPENGSFHCFGCRENGDVIHFIEKTQQLPFREALAQLARRVGMEMPSSSQWRVRETTPEQKNVFRVLNQANEQFRHQLLTRQIALDYMKSRQISSDTIEYFEIGYAVDSWSHLKGQFNEADHKWLQSAGLTRTSGRDDLDADNQGRTYDVFRNRITFPIKNEDGQILGFGGRTLDPDESAKYLNTRQTALFDKSEIVYGLYELSKDQHYLSRVVLVEGFMDVVGLYEHGIDCAVATLGTATSEKHFEAIFRRTGCVVCCFDGDEAGNDAAWRALTIAMPIVNEKREVRFLFLPKDDDPDSFVRKHGKQEFEKLLDGSHSLGDFFVSHLTSNKNVDTIEGRLQFIREALKLLKTSSDRLLREVIEQEVLRRFPEYATQIQETLSKELTYDESPTTLRRTVENEWSAMVSEDASPPSSTDNKSTVSLSKYGYDEMLRAVMQSEVAWSQLDPKFIENVRAELPDSLLVQVLNLIYEQRFTRAAELLSVMAGNKQAYSILLAAYQGNDCRIDTAGKLMASIDNALVSLKERKLTDQLTNKARQASNPQEFGRILHQTKQAADPAFASDKYDSKE